MELKTITLTTQELKKGRPDCKELSAFVAQLDEDQIVVVLAERKQKLDKSKRMHPGVNNTIRVDDALYITTEFQVIGYPKHYMFVAVRQ